jgi:peptidoglycan-N-acetylglucosamine deacetylase
MNILQIDVEDWYCDMDPKDWERCEPRVVAATERLLAMLAETRNKATFFVLGYVAERFPGLIKEIATAGHEIGSHGYGHRRITDQTPHEFEEDVRRSKTVLEGISGACIKGYRAPQFTVMKRTEWALDILQALGFVYDSSIFPVATPLYGMPGAPLFPYEIRSPDREGRGSLLEIPLSVYVAPVLGKRVPVAGGFYLRFFPYAFVRHALQKIERTGGPAVCYIHPWEIDPGKPRVKDLKWYHYYRIGSTETKFRRLLEDFRFVSTEDWIEHERRS